MSQKFVPYHAIPYHAPCGTLHEDRGNKGTVEVGGRERRTSGTIEEMGL